MQTLKHYVLYIKSALNIAVSIVDNVEFLARRPVVFQFLDPHQKLKRNSHFASSAPRAQRAVK